MEFKLKRIFRLALSAPLFALPQAFGGGKVTDQNEWRSYMELLARACRGGCKSQESYACLQIRGSAAGNHC